MPRRTRRRAQGRNSVITDYFTGALTPNTKAELKMSGTKLPFNRPYRILSISVQCASSVPANLQVEILNQYGSIVSTSGPQIVGTNRHIIRVRNVNPVVSPYGLDADTSLVRLIFQCDDKGISGHLTYSASLKFLLYPEIMASKCPGLPCVPISDESEYDTC